MSKLLLSFVKIGRKNHDIHNIQSNWNFELTLS